MKGNGKTSRKTLWTEVDNQLKALNEAKDAVIEAKKSYHKALKAYEDNERVLAREQVATV